MNEQRSGTVKIDWWMEDGAGTRTLEIDWHAEAGADYLSHFHTAHYGHEVLVMRLPHEEGEWTIIKTYLAHRDSEEQVWHLYNEPQAAVIASLVGAVTGLARKQREAAADSWLSDEELVVVLRDIVQAVRTTQGGLGRAINILSRFQ
jgi:hypothetical protein